MRTLGSSAFCSLSKVKKIQPKALLCCPLHCRPQPGLSANKKLRSMASVLPASREWHASRCKIDAALDEHCALHQPCKLFCFPGSCSSVPFAIPPFSWVEFCIALSRSGELRLFHDPSALHPPGPPFQVPNCTTHTSGPVWCLAGPVTRRALAAEPLLGFWLVAARSALRLLIVGTHFWLSVAVFGFALALRLCACVCVLSLFCHCLSILPLSLSSPCSVIPRPPNVFQRPHHHHPHPPSTHSH